MAPKEKEDLAILTARMEERLAMLLDGFEDLKESLNAAMQQMADSYVTHEQFDPIKTLVYGTVASVGLALIGSILALVLK